MVGDGASCRLVLAGSVVLALVGVQAPTARGQDQEIEEVKEGARYVDTKYDFKIDEPRKWLIFPADDPEFKAEKPELDPRRAWFQDHLTVIVVLVQKTPEPYVPGHFGVELLARSDGKPVGSAEVLKQEIRVVAGMKSTWFYMKGRGVGLFMKDEGSVPTKELWVAIPRGKEVVSFALTASEATYERAVETFQKMLKSLEIGGKQTKEQASVKAIDPDNAPDEVDRQAQQALARADQLRAAGKYAEALKTYDEIGTKYAARAAGKLANERARGLREDPEVRKAMEKAEQDQRETAAADEAGKWLKTAREMAKAKNYDLARTYYKKIIDKYPGTTFAKTAEEEKKKLPA